MAKRVNADLSHRTAREIDICGGTKKAKVRPWTMADRAEMKPMVAAVLARVQGEGASGNLSLASIMVDAEEELVDIARATVELPKGVKWDDLLWEDLPSIVQAIWETSIVTNDGGGVAGKALALIGGMTRSLAVRAVLNEAKQSASQPNGMDPSSSPTKTAPSPSLQGSPS